MIHDVIIVGAGAAGLFTGINLDKNLKKIILEKNPKPGIKVLLSGGERANVSNMDIEPMRDYFGQNRKFLLSIFSKYTNWDIMSFFAENNVPIVEEDRSRLILESGDSKELLACLLKNMENNNCKLKCGDGVVEISPLSQPFPPAEKGVDHIKIPSPLGGGLGRGYKVTTSSGKTFIGKNVVVSSGGKSFFHVGTTGDGYNFAEKFGINIIPPLGCLCGLSTKIDLSEISGISCKPKMKVFDRSPPNLPLSRGGTKGGLIYEETGALLFTHFGVSGPIIHNTSVITGEYLNSLNIDPEDFEKYMRDNFYLELEFDLENTPKRAIKFFNLTEDDKIREIPVQSLRSLKEAKATSGGVDTAELTNTMESKKHEGLYFIGEVVDITGKTGGFNLQWAWSSGYVCAEGINKKLVD